MNKLYAYITIILISTSFVNAQTNTCSGSYTSVAANCQAMVIGNGTSGSIRICITTNNIPSGGGTSCSPGGSCNPPYSGGGWSPRIVVYGSDGTTYTGAAQATFTSASGTSCFTVSTTNGYAYIFGLCLTAGTTISWSTVDACGSNVCSGSPPPCGGPICATCATACPACGFTTSPTVATVTSTCPNYAFTPALATGQSATRCATFTANNSTVSFNVIISSNCNAGNVSSFSWTLQQSSCGAVIQSGNLSSLTFTGLTVGQQYTYCYTFTVPSPSPPATSCTHTTHYPYFVGAVPLPIELLSFDVKQDINKQIILSWTTASELNNDYFTIERSLDGYTYDVVGVVKSKAENGNSTNLLNYSKIDTKQLKGLVYYRLKQTDYDGTSTYSGIKSVILNAVNELNFTIYPNPSGENENAIVQFSGNANEEVKMCIYDVTGKVVTQKTIVLSASGSNTIELKNELSSGMYFVNATSKSGATYNQKLMVK